MEVSRTTGEVLCAVSKAFGGRTDSKASVVGISGAVRVVVTCDHADNRKGLRFGEPYAASLHE
jgi:hypothetical protein